MSHCKERNRAGRGRTHLGLLVATAVAGLVVGAPAHAAAKQDPSKRLVLVAGSVVNAYFDGGYRQVKRAEIIYGYGWLDDGRVFVAYQAEGTSEAVAELEVFDLRRSRSAKIISVGGVGEGNFDVNSSTGEIVYNDSRGIHLLKISETNAHVVSDIQKGVSCLGVFWIDTKTVGCLDLTRSALVKFSVGQP